MKVRLMTKVSAATLISAIACSIFTGCTEKDLYNPERGKTELKPESEYFDFATTAQVAFDVNYGKIAGGALIEVFTEDPITYQTNNLYSINGEAVFKIFADHLTKLGSPHVCGSRCGKWQSGGRYDRK